MLEATGASDLFFVGFSMGSTQYFAFLSELPEYNDKIRAGFTMAPAVYAGQTDYGFIADYSNEIVDFMHDELGAKKDSIMCEKV